MENDPNGNHALMFPVVIYYTLLALAIALGTFATELITCTCDSIALTDFLEKKSFRFTIHGQMRLLAVHVYSSARPDDWSVLH